MNIDWTDWTGRKNLPWPITLIIPAMTSHGRTAPSWQVNPDGYSDAGWKQCISQRKEVVYLIKIMDGNCQTFTDVF